MTDESLAIRMAIGRYASGTQLPGDKELMRILYNSYGIIRREAIGDIIQKLEDW